MKSSDQQLLYAFMGWLTTREKPLVLSASDDAAPAAEAVDAFIKSFGPGNDPKTLAGLPVAGYKPQSEAKVALVNEFKADEERLLRKVDGVMAALRPDSPDEPAKDQPAYDRRWAAIARTHFDQGFMALNRAVFQPGRVRLPEDDQPQIEDMPMTGKTVAQEAVETLKGA